MAATGLTFSAQVSEWVAATERRVTAVFRESTQRLVSEMQSGQNRIPVDTGFARASIRASLSDMPKIESGNVGRKGQSYSGDGNVTAVIASANLGQTIFVGWTAAYAGVLEFGHSSQAPQGFVRVNAIQWPRIVEEVAAEARSRGGG